MADATGVFQLNGQTVHAIHISGPEEPLNRGQLELRETMINETNQGVTVVRRRARTWDPGPGVRTAGSSRKHWRAVRHRQGSAACIS